MTKIKIPREFVVNIVGEYTDYEDFFEKNKTKIYTGIVQCFILLSNSNRKTIKYIVSASTKSKRNGIIEFNTEFLFRKDECDLLVDYILEHFEEIEEYEKCKDIIILYNSLTNSKKETIFK
ncbi:MAG: hypothetical protein ACO25K_08335 [Candidatus Fonsibacter ubiquis]|jgi:hypothetical protein